jgi:putative transcriptional regulator
MYRKLKEIRYKNAYTTKQMAEMLDISKPFYCQLENGNRRLSYDMAVRISKIFVSKPDEIFYNDHIEEKKY